MTNIFKILIICKFGVHFSLARINFSLQSHALRIESFLFFLFMLLTFSLFSQNEIEGSWSFVDTSGISKKDFYDQCLERYFEYSFKNDSVYSNHVIYAEHRNRSMRALIDSNTILLTRPEGSESLFEFKVVGQKMIVWQPGNPSNQIQVLKISPPKGKLPKNITAEITSEKQEETWKRFNTYLIKSGMMTKRQVRKGMRSWKPEPPLQSQ